MKLLVAIALSGALLSAAVVTRPVANMYSKPTEDSDVVSQALYGAHVTVLETSAGFKKIRTSDDYTGWIPSADLRDGAYAAGPQTVQVESLFAHIYQEPDVTKHRPMLTLPYETKLEALTPWKQGERWLKVRLVDAREGYLQSGDSKPELDKLAVPDVLKLAEKFLGLPYTWGGTSAYGYDCSGFMQMLCRRRGVQMPRDAAPQSRWDGVREVTKADLQPGDLLYFGKSAAKITHTGMYIGAGKFINATTYQHPMVRFDDLNEPRWAEILVACRRLK